MYGMAESLYCTPDTNMTLYVNYTGIKIKKKEKNKQTKKDRKKFKRHLNEVA